MSDTPRTDDALIHNADLYDQGHGWSNMVEADFARQLERELADAKQQATEARKWSWEMADKLDELRAKNKRRSDLLRAAFLKPSSDAGEAQGLI